MYLAMRPWTRRSALHMLSESEDDDPQRRQRRGAGDPGDAAGRAARRGADAGNQHRGTVYGLESVYTRCMGISGPTLRDSYHLGQTIVNDYGGRTSRASTYRRASPALTEYGRFSLYVRGEYQHAPRGGYSQALATQLSLHG